MRGAARHWHNDVAASALEPAAGVAVHRIARIRLDGMAGGRCLQAQLLPQDEAREVSSRGRVVGLPIAEQRRTRFQLLVDEDQSQPAALRGKLLQLAWYDDFGAERIGPRVALHAGARWQLRLRLRAPRGLRNPGGFDAGVRRWRSASPQPAMYACLPPHTRLHHRRAWMPGAKECRNASPSASAVPRRLTCERSRWAIRVRSTMLHGPHCARPG